MIDHLSISVSDFAHSRAFYERVLAPLGYAQVMEVTSEESGGYEGVAFGCGGKPGFWIGNRDVRHGQLHFAFVAPDRASVDAFHAAALEAGARDNGAPGLRSHYHPDYYAAFVLDPDGHNIEAACRKPEVSA